MSDNEEDKEHTHSRFRHTARTNVSTERDNDAALVPANSSHARSRYIDNSLPVAVPARSIGGHRGRGQPRSPIHFTFDNICYVYFGLLVLLLWIAFISYHNWLFTSRVSGPSSRRSY